MKTHSIKATFLIFVLLAANFIIFFTSSCSKDSNENQSAGISTYSGTVKIEQDASSYDDQLDLSFTSGSTKNGTFFRKSDGSVGLFSGTETDGILNVSGTIKDNSSITFSGTIKITNNTLAIDIIFHGNNSAVSCAGILTKADCIKISGDYYVNESYKLTITADGETDTLKDSGSGYITLNQAECHVTYEVPGTDANREGDINGNKFSITGVCMLPANGVTYTQNSFSAEVTIIDNNHFEYVSIMQAKGSYQGQSFTVKGSSTGDFNRIAKSHSALLAGDSPWLQTMTAVGQSGNSQRSMGANLNSFLNEMPKNFIFGISTCK